MEELPTPIWHKYFGISGKKLVLAPSEDELQFKAKEFKLSDKACLGRVGRVGVVSIYEIFQGKMTKGKLNVYDRYIGVWPQNSWNEIQELGFQHPVFLPKRGCFGFINGNLIIGNRHHQEVMYRLINDKGWTWEQLMEAKQVWGWFYNYGEDLFGEGNDPGTGTVRFSSDAGTMTSKKVKKDCIKTFEEWFNCPFTEAEGYGGKNKDNYGGDFEEKYGKPGNWTGYKVEYDNTIITPLPDPPIDK